MGRGAAAQAAIGTHAQFLPLAQLAQPPQLACNCALQRAHVRQAGCQVLPMALVTVSAHTSAHCRASVNGAARCAGIRSGCMPTWQRFKRCTHPCTRRAIPACSLLGENSYGYALLGEGDAYSYNLGELEHPQSTHTHTHKHTCMMSGSVCPLLPPPHHYKGSYQAIKSAADNRTTDWEGR